MKNIKLSYGITLINKKFKKNQYYHYLKTFNHVLVVPKIKNKFILVSQKRIPINKINYELPSGNVEWNETPVRCANKELFEETGTTGELVDQFILDSSEFGIVVCSEH